MRPSRHPEEPKRMISVGDYIPLFDLFLDLPHPNASAGAERARIIEPPDTGLRRPDVFSELYEAGNISRIARFAFPEHDDQKLATQFSYQKTLQRAPSGLGKGPLNEFDVYFYEFISQCHTFSLQLSDNVTKLHGHVLRYLPPHQEARSRADVGRRGARAMVLLTQAPGGERFFGAILKTLEAVVLQGDISAVISDMGDAGREKAMQYLQGLHRSHAKQYSHVASKIARLDNAQSREAVAEDDFLVLPAVECPLFVRSRMKGRILPGDFVKFLLPPSLQVGFRVGLGPEDVDAPMLPLIRCLGPEHTLRLLSAVMCERRIMLVSKNAARLSACVRAASAMLAQGMLQWQHILIPVLPPHLLKYLLAPSPYLIGVLEQHLDEVERLMRLKEVLCVHLDRNLLRTFDIPAPAQMIPDMLSQSGLSTKQTSPAHTLCNDIEQIIKAEKRMLGDGADSKAAGLDEKGTTSNSSRHLIKASSMDNNGFGKKSGLFGKKGKGDEGLNSKSTHDLASLFGRVMRGDSLHEDQVDDESEQRLDDIRPYYFEYDKGRRKRGDDEIRRELAIDEDWEAMATLLANERGEEGLRAALTAFFLITHGDMGELLSQDPRDGSFLLDRRKYVKTKSREHGVEERTPMFLLYKHFSGTVMLEQHLQLRLSEVQRGAPVLLARHMSLFHVCEKHLRLKKIGFSTANIRRVISKSAFSSPMHASVEKSEKARARAVTLTSAQPFDGNLSQALSSVMADCHDCSVVLPQTIAVVWSRLDDLKGSSWKHPLLGLHLLKNLVMHGPITSVSLAMEGISKLLRLTTYSSAKSAETNEEIRESARQLLAIIVDRSEIFFSRRHATAIRAGILDSQGNIHLPEKSKLRRLPYGKRFRDYHKILQPPIASFPAIRTNLNRRTRASSSKAGMRVHVSNQRSGIDQAPFRKPERKKPTNGESRGRSIDLSPRPSQTRENKGTTGEQARVSSAATKNSNKPQIFSAGPVEMKKLINNRPRVPTTGQHQGTTNDNRRRTSSLELPRSSHENGRHARRKDRPVRRNSSPLEAEAPTPMPVRRRSSLTGGYERRPSYS